MVSRIFVFDLIILDQTRDQRHIWNYLSAFDAIEFRSIYINRLTNWIITFYKVTCLWFYPWIYLDFRGIMNLWLVGKDHKYIGRLSDRYTISRFNDWLVEVSINQSFIYGSIQASMGACLRPFRAHRCLDRSINKCNR